MEWIQEDLPDTATVPPNSIILEFGGDFPDGNPGKDRNFSTFSLIFHLNFIVFGQIYEN